MQLLYSYPFSGGSLTFFLPRGMFGFFGIEFRGTNGTTPKTRANLGNIQLIYNTEPIINCDVDFFSQLTDLKSGYSRFNSVASAELDAFILLPCGEWNDRNNSYIINESDKAYFKLDYPDLQDINGTVYIYGVNKDGIQNYLYAITTRNVVSQGASIISDVHRLPNVSQIYLKGGSSQVSHIQIIRDNIPYIDAERTDLKNLSDALNEVETNANTLIEMDLNLSKDIRETIGDEILFKYTFSAGATLEQYFAYKILTPLQSSKSVVELETKAKTKQRLGYESWKTPGGVKAITTQ